MVVRQPVTRSASARPARQDELAFERFGNPAIPHRTETGAGTVRIVSSWAFGGSAVQSGGDLTIAIRLALELAGNAAGGYAIDYQPLDDSNEAYANVWDATTEIANAEQARDDAATVAFIGGVHSGALTQSLPVLSQAVPSLLVVTPAATWPGLTRRLPGITPDFEPGRYFPTGARNLVRLAPTDDRLGQTAARWALNDGGRRRVAVFHDRGRYGQCVALSFAAAFAAGGGSVTGTEALPADPVTFERYVDAVAAAGADGVFIGAVTTPAIAQFIGELRRRFGPDDLLIIGGDGLASDDLFAAAPDGGITGLTIAGPVLPSDLIEDGAVWAATMRERIGEDRDPDPFAIHAFEAAIAILQAIDVVGSGDRASILAAAQATRDFRGLSGTFAIDTDGDRVDVPVRLAQVQSGRFVTFAVVSA